jgi:hypothetical protein
MSILGAILTIELRENLVDNNAVPLRSKWEIADGAVVVPVRGMDQAHSIFEWGVAHQYVCQI